MGLRETVLGELDTDRLSVPAVVRRVLEKHPLADWKPDSIDITVRRLKREGLVRVADEASDQIEDPVLLELTAEGLDWLRGWRDRAPAPPSLREDLLLQIAGSEEAELPKLEAATCKRIHCVLELANASDDPRADVSLDTPMPWRERRVLIAREIDLGICDGLLKGLRRAHREMVDAQGPRSAGGR